MRDTIRDKRKLKSSLGLVPDNRGDIFHRSREIFIRLCPAQLFRGFILTCIFHGRQTRQKCRLINRHGPAEPTYLTAYKFYIKKKKRIAALVYISKI